MFGLQRKLGGLGGVAMGGGDSGGGGGGGGSTVSDAEFNGAIRQDKANKTHSGNSGSTSYGNSGYYSHGQVRSSDSGGQPTPRMTTRAQSTQMAVGADKPTDRWSGRVPSAQHTRTDRRGLLNDKDKLKGDWGNAKSYIAADLSPLEGKLKAEGLDDKAIKGIMNQEKGIQGAFGYLSDNDANLNNFDTYGEKEYKNNKTYQPALIKGGVAYKDMKNTDVPMHEDAIEKGLTEQDRANYAFHDQYAPALKTGADTAAVVGDFFVPYARPFQGAVDAAQAAKASEGLIGKEMSSADKWSIGAKSAVPFARTLQDNLQGSAQYENYGKTQSAKEIFGEDYDSAKAAVEEYPSADELLKDKGIDPDSPEADEIRKAYDYWSHFNSSTKTQRPNEATFGRRSQFNTGR